MNGGENVILLLLLLEGRGGGEKNMYCSMPKRFLCVEPNLVNNVNGNEA